MEAERIAEGSLLARAPHADCTFHPHRSRLAANALLVQHGAVMVRLEGRFDKSTAIAIARSLHG